MKIVVLGGHGMIGEALQERLRTTSHKSRFPRRSEFDVRSSAIIPEADCFIDLVPSPPPREFQDLSRDEYHSRFTKPHMEFMTRAMATGLKRYVFISSGGAVYGKASKPLTEEAPTQPISYYGESKLMLEEHLKKTARCDYLILRPSNVFNSLPASRLKTGLVGILEKKFVAREPFEILGEKTIAKDYIASTDVAESIALALTLGKNEVINISSAKTFSIGEIIDAFEKKFGYTIPMVQKPRAPNDIPWSCLSNEKAKKVLGFSPKIDLLEFLR